MPSSTSQKSWLRCLVPHVASQLTPESFITIIHVANSNYLRFLHDLIAYLLIHHHRVHVLDFHRNIKPLYLQQLLRRTSTQSSEYLGNLWLQVILDGDHALNEYRRLHQAASQDKLAAVFLVNPSSLFRRLRGGVKQAASTLNFQYEVAQVLASEGYAVVVTDAGGREYHRTEVLVPALLAHPSKLILQFLPKRILLAK